MGYIVSKLGNLKALVQREDVKRYGRGQESAHERGMPEMPHSHPWLGNTDAPVYWRLLKSAKRHSMVAK